MSSFVWFADHYTISRSWCSHVTVSGVGLLRSMWTSSGCPRSGHSNRMWVCSLVRGTANTGCLGAQAPTVHAVHWDVQLLYAGDWGWPSLCGASERWWKFSTRADGELDWSLSLLSVAFPLFQEVEVGTFGRDCWRLIWRGDERWGVFCQGPQEPWCTHVQYGCRLGRPSLPARSRGVLCGALEGLADKGDAHLITS